MQNKNPNITFKEVQSNLQMRDSIDSTREVSPLKMAADAILLDNSTITMEQQLEFALHLIQEKLK